jgi:hypothetical protein
VILKALSQGVEEISNINKYINLNESMIYSQKVMDPQVTKIKNKFMFEVNLILNISKK